MTDMVKWLTDEAEFARRAPPLRIQRTFRTRLDRTLEGRWLIECRRCGAWWSLAAEAARIYEPMLLRHVEGCELPGAHLVPA